MERGTENLGIGLGFVRILEKESKDSNKETEIEKKPWHMNMLTRLDTYSDSLQEETKIGVS